MAADSFHARVEKEFRIMKNINNFLDFVACVRAAGITIELVTGDFWEWSNGLSQGKASKDSKPLLEEVCMAEFRVGEAKMYFKRSLDDSDFKCTHLMMKKYKVVVNEKAFMSSQTLKERPGLDSGRKQGILDKLCPLMPTGRKGFWNILYRSCKFIILFQLNSFNLLMC